MRKMNLAKQARRVITSMGVRPARIKPAPDDTGLYKSKKGRMERWCGFLEKRQVQGLRTLSLKTGVPSASLVRLGIDYVLRKYRNVIQFTPGNTGRLLRLLCNKKTCFDLAQLAGVSPEEFIISTLTKMETETDNTLLSRIQERIQSRLKQMEEDERLRAKGLSTKGPRIVINFPKEREPASLIPDIERFCDEIQEAELKEPEN